MDDRIFWLMVLAMLFFLIGLWVGWACWRDRPRQRLAAKSAREAEARVRPAPQRRCSCRMTEVGWYMGDCSIHRTPMPGDPDWIASIDN